MQLKCMYVNILSEFEDSSLQYIALYISVTVCSIFGVILVFFYFR